MAVYTAYFLFTIYEVDWNLQRAGNAYSDLGVPPDVTEKQLSSRFRKISARFHPDKIRPGVDFERQKEFYVRLKEDRDIILDPAKRFAHDRFGPQFLERAGRDTRTIHDWVQLGLTSIIMTYVPLVVILIASNALGYFREGYLWRYLSLAAIVIYEVRTAVRPDHPPFLVQFVNPLFAFLNIHAPLLPYQATSLLRNATLSLTQLLGLLIPMSRADSPRAAGEDSDEMRHRQMDRLVTSINEFGEHTSRLLELESMPYRGNERTKHELREAMKKYMVQNVVHSEREVRNAIGVSMRKRREGAPMGAKGTR